MPPPTDTLGRLTKVVAVSNGNIYTSFNGDTSWSPTTNSSSNTPPVSASVIPYSAVNAQKVFFVDGRSYTYLDPKTNVVSDWVPTAGSLPTDSQGNRARLIATWRGRTVLSGLKNDGGNWFMSKVNDPFNWDYFPSTVTVDQAVSGNNAQAGMLGDIVTALVPFSDDLLIMGGDHSIYLFRGDPMEGGRIDLVTDTIGMRFGMPWCQDPYGTVYFTSTDLSVYAMRPGEQPVRVSTAIDNYISAIGEPNVRADSLVRMAWNQKYQGCHWFLIPNPTAATGGVVHFYYEQRTNAWWMWQFGSPTTGVDGSYLDPVSVATYDGPDPNDRAVLLGCWDGNVRAIDPAATTDDGLPIYTGVWIGPILTANMDEMMLSELQGEMAATSADVTYKVYSGASLETAADGSQSVIPAATGTFPAGLSTTQAVQVAAHSLYLKLECNIGRWAMNWIRGLVQQKGKTRRRGIQ